MLTGPAVTGAGIIARIICQTYESVFRRKQGFENKAMQVAFNLRLNEGEDGDRYLILVLFGHGYVCVAYREEWRIRPEPNVMRLDFRSRYTEGKSEWVIMSNHDSCWRDDGVQKFMRENMERMCGIDIVLRLSGVTWFEEHEMTADDHREMAEALRKAYS